MDKPTILVVDDEALVRRVIGDALARAGYTVELAACGGEAVERLEQPGIDLLLLDLQLGDIDGVEVMEDARRRWPHLPIIMLTAHGSLPSAIAAVRCAAADYLLKPIGIDELRSRVANVLSGYSDRQARDQQLRDVFGQMHDLMRREGLLAAATVGSAPPTAEVYQSGPLRLDARQHLVTMRGQPVEVTPSEFVILQELLSVPGAVIACKQLVQALNTPTEDDEEARQLIRPHIVRLRRKLEPDPQQPQHLISVRSVGYRWVAAH